MFTKWKCFCLKILIEEFVFWCFIQLAPFLVFIRGRFKSHLWVFHLHLMEAGQCYVCPYVVFRFFFFEIKLYIHRCLYSVCIFYNLCPSLFNLYLNCVARFAYNIDPGTVLVFSFLITVIYFLSCHRCEILLCIARVVLLVLGNNYWLIVWVAFGIYTFAERYSVCSDFSGWWLRGAFFAICIYVFVQ